MRHLLAISLILLACGSDSEFPDPRVAPPTALASNDSDFTIHGLRQWAIVTNDVDPGHPSFELVVDAPLDIEFIDVWLSSGPGIRLEKIGHQFHGQIDLRLLDTGEHQILLAADGRETAFAKHTFKRSHPVYVIVTTDWDDADTSDLALDLQDELHAEHPELLLTHFVGPYTFTDPELSEERVATLVQWLKKNRDTYQDEIGLHIHPYCNFVEQVGTVLGIEEIECKTEESTVYSRDNSGYTVRVSAYNEDDFTNMLLASDKLFMEQGLGKPTSFRAGGWTAELNTMQSLEAAGYVADTSALNWARLDEWNRPFAGTLYDWNKEHWSSIGDTSQPYYPSTTNILETGSDRIHVLEVPDNGILVDYVDIAEMIEIFESNWNGGPATSPINYSIGFHPSNFSQAYKDRMTGIFNHVEQFLASQDKGPVIYARLSDMPKVWKP